MDPWAYLKGRGATATSSPPAEAPPPPLFVVDPPAEPTRWQRTPAWVRTGIISFLLVLTMTAALLIPAAAPLAWILIGCGMLTVELTLIWYLGETKGRGLTWAAVLLFLYVCYRVISLVTGQTSPLFNTHIPL